MSNNNVISQVVDNGLCIGCGVCAGVCPANNLRMECNDYGEYNPVDQGRCIDNCNLCTKVCPFMDGNDNEDVIGKNLYGNIPDIKHTNETGYYLKSYVGYSPNREIAASGGMASYLLETLLDQGLVDKVICVAPNESETCLFEYRVFENPEEVRGSVGSAYYPTQLSDVVTYIKETPGSYVITALPCFAKALRLASEEIPILKKRIKFILGLVCGQLKSTFYTRYIAYLADVNEPLKSCFFRKKSPDQPANNYTFTCESISGKKGDIRWDQGVSQVWTTRCFTPLACNYCDDVFAECADAVFMDAWLPKYRGDPKGTSLAIVRNLEIQKIIDETAKKEKTIKLIPITEVIRSQAGPVRIKRKYLRYRLFKADKKVILKRVKPTALFYDSLQRKEVEILDKIQCETRQLTIEIKTGHFKIEDIQNKIRPYLDELQKVRRQRAMVTLPFRAVRKIFRLLKSR